jgi:hypothetical protein
MKLKSLEPRTRLYLLVAFGKTLAYIAGLFFFVDGFGGHAQDHPAAADKSCHHSFFEFFN